MKIFSKLSLLTMFLFIFFFSIHVKAVYYDAETNTYIYEENKTNTESLDMITGNVAGTGVVENLSGNTSTEVSTGDIKINNSSPLEYLHQELTDHEMLLLKSLQEKYQELHIVLQTLTGGAYRLETLQCLGLVDKQINLEENLKIAYDKLSKDIQSTSVDLHNNIDALELKIKQKLLGELSKNLEIAGLKNKVDTYMSEYLNMINTFVDLINTEIHHTDIMLQDVSKKGKDILGNYEKRVHLYEDLQNSYDDFIKKSSFAGALVGPNFVDVASLVKYLKLYYVSLFTQKRFDSVTIYFPIYSKGRKFANDKYQIALDVFKNQLDKQIDIIIGNLYPVEDLQLINKSMLTLDSAYVYQNGKYNCEAFSGNRTIDMAASALKKQMKKLLEKLENAARKVAVNGQLPRNMKDFKKGLLGGLSNTVDTILKDVSYRYKTILKDTLLEQSITMLSHPVLSELDKQESIIRKFLQDKYYAGIQGDKLDKFILKLETANKKIENILSSATGKNKNTLELIQKIVKEFLN